MIAIRFLSRQGCFCIELYVIAFVYTKKKKQKLATTNEEYSKLLSDPFLAWMPTDYRSSDCMAKVAEYIRNNRADTLRECIDLLETEMNRNRAEQAALVGALYAKKREQKDGNGKTEKYIIKRSFYYEQNE